MKPIHAALAACLLALPAAVQAAPITGQLELIGSINPNSTFSASNFNVDFVGVGRAQVATGDFDSFIIDLDEMGMATQFTLNDLVGTGPAVIYSGGGFTFTATSFYNFVAAPNTPRGFQASGTLTGNGFDATDAVFAFSTQSTGRETMVRVAFSSGTNPVSAVPLPATGLMLVTGALAMGALRRKKRA